MAHALSQTDLEAVATAYMRLAAIARGSADTPSDATVDYAGAFDEHISNVLTHLSEESSSTSTQPIGRAMHACYRGLLWMCTHSAVLDAARALSRHGDASLGEQFVAAARDMLAAHGGAVSDAREALRAAYSLATESQHAAQQQLAQVQDAAARHEAELASEAAELRRELAHVREEVRAALSCAARMPMYSSAQRVVQSEGIRKLAQEARARISELSQLKATHAALQASHTEAQGTIAQLKQQLAKAQSASSAAPAPAPAAPPAAASMAAPASGPAAATLAADRPPMEPPAVREVSAMLTRGISFVSVSSEDGESTVSRPTTTPAHGRGCGEPKYMKPTASWKRAHKQPSAPHGSARSGSYSKQPAAPAEDQDARADAEAQRKVMDLLFAGDIAPTTPGRTSAPPPSARSQQTASTAAGGKILALKALHDTINAMYASKARFDTRCASLRQPRETMEQHMYTYLNTRFGLRQLVVEQARALITSLDWYAPHDNDAATFAAILRCQVDEDFRLVQAQLKETARELLRLHLKAINVSAGDAELAALLAQRMGSGIALFTDRAAFTSTDRPDLLTGVTEREWTDIVSRMFTPADVSLLMLRLREAVMRLAVASAHGLASRVSTLVSPTAAPSSASSSPIASPRTRAMDAGLLLLDAAALREVMQGMSHAESVAIVARRNPEGVLPWDAFLKVLLDFQLEAHARFLSPLRHVFTHVDPANTGIVTADNFRQIVVGINPMRTAAELDDMLRSVDPFGHGRITFSFCVTAVAADLALRRSTTAQASAPPPPALVQTSSMRRPSSRRM